MFNTVGFELHYTGRVANPSDIVLFRKQHCKVKTDNKFDKETLEALFNVEGVSLFNTGSRMMIRSFGLFEGTVASCRRTEKPQIFRVRMTVLGDLKPVFWSLHCVLQ